MIVRRRGDLKEPEIQSSGSANILSVREPAVSLIEFLSA